MGLGKTLAELEGMTAEELNGWIAYYQMEPWGCLVEDHRAATGLDLLFAVNSKQGTKIPRWFDRDPQSNVQAIPTPEELQENIRDFFIGKTIIKQADEPPAPTPPVKKSRKPRKQAAPAK